ncbi:MAG: fucose isomerase [bacterium]|nr:fucose isomerase [bacterium]
MKHKVKLGVVCLGRTTFDHKAAEEIYKKMQSRLSDRDDIEWAFVDGLVIEVEDAKKAAVELLKYNIDGFVCISGTFHLGHLVLEINKILNKPILLWGLNELPYNGGKIRLNSVCGVNLNASNLYKSGIKNYQVTIGDNIDEEWVDAIRIKSCLQNAHVGILGYRAHGFFNLGVYDLNAYKELGVLIDHYELSDIFNQEIEDDLLDMYRKKIKDIFDCSCLSDEQTEKVALLTAKYKKFITNNNLDALAVRCWPESARDFGISPCAALSILQSEGHIMACEGDFEGAISMLSHKAIGGETPYLFDFSQVNFEENYALLWHCGVAPCNLWDKKCVRSLDTYFAGGKGVTADFVLKSGDISIFRMDSAGTDVRLFLQEAKVIPMEKDLRGTYAKAIFNEPVKNILDKVVYTGVAHHASLVYGKYIKPFEILARINNWEIIK